MYIIILAMTGPLSMDQVLIMKLTDIVLANLANDNFGVEELTMKAGMNRITIHRKIRSIRHQTINQFIREIRLQKAKEILENGEGTVAEVAFRVGFGSPTYFIKCFHELYGFAPGEVRKKKFTGSPDDQVVKQTGKIGLNEEIRLKPDLRSVNKILKHKNILLASIGILAGLLAFAFIYVLLRTPERSIVVLPFKNLSNDIENQYFADGIMEGILNNLFRISEMRVISRTSAEYF